MTVLLFHTLREYAGTGSFVLATDGPMTPAQLWEALEARHPGISRFAASTRIARNQDYLAGSERLHPGDEVALIPPVSGG
ncbi:MAG: MoaD/ThiS family protein [Blastochloris sp.]|nr:MoaD/ThiS family protein [Blastochloris sp.]